MARGTLGKSRTAPKAQGISNPVFNYTDAIPRKDLRGINHTISYSRPVLKAGQRPSNSDGRSPQGTTTAPVSGFDFRITVPPDNVVTSNTDLVVDESKIGIALGSPRLLEPHNAVSQPQRIPPPTPPDDERPSASLQRKSSKWRKIGGLFKAKSAMGPNVNKPFYQVRSDNEGLLQGSTHSIDYKSRQRTDTRPEPIGNTEVWPCLVSEQEAIMRQQTSERQQPGSLLQVEIPTTEMERYSVMFGGLLNNSRPSLLNRRSKTLDDVGISSEELSPPSGPPRRRATSPTRSRSPNFTLFPTTPSCKASRILGTQNLPRAPDSLRKAQSFQEEPQEDASSEASEETLTAQSPPEKASHRTQASVTSFLSSTSIDSDDEPLLIHEIEPVRTYAGMDPPRWDSLNRKPPAVAEITPETSTKKLTINTRELRADSASTSSTTSPILSPLDSIRTATSVSPTAANKGSPGPPNFPTPPRSRTHSPEQHQIPTIEVSIARSVSVSKGKRQMLVPVRTRPGQFNINERLVPRQARTPQVMGGQSGHRPGFSQDVHIEMA
ncbi:hypothetical protein BJX99DRAFT_219011 [Aspergillus californicus]